MPHRVIFCLRETYFLQAFFVAGRGCLCATIKSCMSRSLHNYGYGFPPQNRMWSVGRPHKKVSPAVVRYSCLALHVMKQEITGLIFMFMYVPQDVLSTRIRVPCPSPPSPWVPYSQSGQYVTCPLSLSLLLLPVAL